MTKEESNEQVPESVPQDANQEAKNERTWAVFCHLSAFLAILCIPFTNILGPLTIWLVKRNEMPLVDQEGKESVNFQISMTIYFIITLLLCLVFIGFLLIFPLVLADIIFVIIAAIKVSNGESYRYPLNIRLIK